MDDKLYVKFWGTRGSCPAPYRDRMKYGGNTSCMSAAWEGGLAVFDGGTGIAGLGQYLDGKGESRGMTGGIYPAGEGAGRAQVRPGRESAGSGPIPIHIFISHLHLDHISGLPLFTPFFRKDAEIHIYGEARDGMSLEQVLSRVLGPPYWPVTFKDMKARIIWHEVEADREYTLKGGALVRTMRAGHPNQCLLYRLERGGNSLVYGLDCELTDTLWDRYREFSRSCGLLVFDAAYKEEEYDAYRGYGHGTWQQGVEMARQCGAGRLCLAHHEWGRRDGELEEIEKTAKKQGINADFASEDRVILLDHPKEDVI